jgi:hypothetical protein
MLNQLVTFWIGISRWQTYTLCLLKCGAWPITLWFYAESKTEKIRRELAERSLGTGRTHGNHAVILRRLNYSRYSGFGVDESGTVGGSVLNLNARNQRLATPKQGLKAKGIRTMYVFGCQDGAACALSKRQPSAGSKSVLDDRTL